MAVKDFPNITPDNEEWTLSYNTQTFTADLNGATQTREMEGARWTATLTFSNRQGRDARELKAFLGSLRGRAGRFWLTPSDDELYGTATQSGTLDAEVLSGESSIEASGFAPSDTEILAPGDFFELNGELKQVTNSVTGTTIEFAPPMRTTVSAGATVSIDSPRSQMMLVDDDQAGWSMTAPIIYNVTIECREPLDI